MEERIIGNRYKILELIGSGGMAEVYKAFDTLLNREVAVKLLRPQYTDDEGFIAGFKKEAQSAACLVQPNIINIYDVGRDDEYYYIVMEYVKGRTLKKMIEEEGPLDELTAVILAHGIASALKHAHSKGIIHCDIKPHNILLDENNTPKVGDFGIARAISSATMTYSSALVGSVHYLSPEQVSGDTVSAQSDLYSLGILLFEMLTGRLPFNADTPVAVALMHVQERMPSVREFKPEISETLDKIVSKALAKDKTTRYRSAEEMLEDLEYAADELTGGEDYLEKKRNFHANVYQPDKGWDLEETQKLNRSDYVDQLLGSGDGKGKKKQIKWKRVFFAGLVAVSLLVISLFALGVIGGPEVTVPNVTGKTLAEAQSILQQVNLGYNIDEEYNDKVVPGTVFAQNPPANRAVKAGRKITLSVSKGVELGDIPDLKGKSLTEAKALLKVARFELGNVSYKYLAGYPEETILEQSIMPPAKLPIGSKLDIIVNIKNNQVVLPDFVGLSTEVAKNKLKELGLTLGKTETAKSKEPNDTVISMRPAATEVVNIGSAVDLVISKNDEKKTTGTQQQHEEFVEFVVPDGNEKQDVKIVVIDDNGSKVSYHNTHSPGVRLRQQVTGTGAIKVQFYCNDRLVEEKNF